MPEKNHSRARFRLALFNGLRIRVGVVAVVVVLFSMMIIPHAHALRVRSAAGIINICTLNFKRM